MTRLTGGIDGPLWSALQSVFVPHTAGFEDSNGRYLEGIDPPVHYFQVEVRSPINLDTCEKSNPFYLKHDHSWLSRSSTVQMVPPAVLEGDKPLGSINFSQCLFLMRDQGLPPWSIVGPSYFAPSNITHTYRCASSADPRRSSLEL